MDCEVRKEERSPERTERREVTFFLSSHCRDINVIRVYVHLGSMST